jgi:hypothetical protein
MAIEKHQPSPQPTSTPTTRPDSPNIEKGSNSMPIYQNPPQPPPKTPSPPTQTKE